MFYSFLPTIPWGMSLNKDGIKLNFETRQRGASTRSKSLNNDEGKNSFTLFKIFSHECKITKKGDQTTQSAINGTQQTTKPNRSPEILYLTVPSLYFLLYGAVT